MHPNLPRLINQSTPTKTSSKIQFTIVTKMQNPSKLHAKISNLTSFPIIPKAHAYNSTKLNFIS